MLKITERAVTALAFAVVVLVPVRAQESKDPSAPKPAQILTPRTIFISNAAAECPSFYCSAPDQPYNEFYASMKSWGRYELMSSPADADLVFELHCNAGRPGELPQLRLMILDSKTRVTLWRLDETVGAAARQATGRKNFEKAMSALVQDVQKFVIPGSTAASAPEK
ncbi:MAG: hypothetical protein WBX08_11140 [Candidatus Sulfotelmatobacter sp.]